MFFAEVFFLDRTLISLKRISKLGIVNKWNFFYTILDRLLDSFKICEPFYSRNIRLFK